MAVAMQQERRIDQQRHLSIERATRSNDIDAAKRLRYRVFAGELGARIQARRPGHDEDPFDAWCDHLVVRDQSTSEIVGTYRILTAERAKRFGTFYSEGEFDLTRLARLRPGIAEIGRACIREDYRSGAVIMLLWQGIAQYMREHGAGYLIGCASIGMADGGADAVRVYHQLAPRHLAPIEYRVFPRHPLMPRGGDKPAELAAPASIPSLLKGYLRVGAWIAGEPARDPELNTADLFVLLSLAHVDARYARHYLKAA